MSLESAPGKLRHQTTDVVEAFAAVTRHGQQIEIIARGNTLIHMLNGRVFCVVIVDDPTRRALKGIISLQLEGPADDEVWYRNIWLKKP